MQYYFVFSTFLITFYATVCLFCTNNFSRLFTGVNICDKIYTPPYNASHRQTYTDIVKTDSAFISNRRKSKSAADIVRNAYKIGEIAIENGLNRTQVCFKSLTSLDIFPKILLA